MLAFTEELDMVRDDNKDYDWVLDKYFIDPKAEEEFYSKAPEIFERAKNMTDEEYEQLAEKLEDPEYDVWQEKSLQQER